MKDRFGRTIDYLRISVTDRCNLRCRYCMPKEGVPLLRHDQILSFEEIVEAARTAVQMGVTQIRLTGGEPLVRRGIVELVASIADIDGVEDLSMTTNGILLARYARDLHRAGLKRVNVSLDTTDPARYRQITRGGDIQQVFEGIRTARQAGLDPVKLNCVVSESSAESDAESVRQFGQAQGFQVRMIRQMTFATGCFSVVEGGAGGDCERCNRIRLSSDGKVRPCLFSDIFFDSRRLGPSEAMRRAVDMKPKAGKPCGHTAMQTIGG